MKKQKTERIFLDHASATPMLPEVSSAMQSFHRKYFANPSALYKEALEVRKEMDDSRKSIAALLKVQPDEIVFTGSGTEADNLAVFGILSGLQKKSHKDIPHIIVSSFEHSAILEAAKAFEKNGGAVTYLPVSREGVVDPEAVLAALTPRTVLVSVMYANNEIGTIQPIKEIAKIIRYYKKHHGTRQPFFQKHEGGQLFPLFHTDASQAANYLPLEVPTLGVDLMTLDAAKIYGPKGIGLLYVKRGVEITPRIVGGGQEGGRRSGTEHVAAILGFAKALTIVQGDREKESKRLIKLRDYGLQEIHKRAKGSHKNGEGNILPNTLNVCFPGTDSEFLVLKLDVRGICVSSSSSCESRKEDSRSKVIASLGSDGCDSSSLRITLGRNTKKSDIQKLIRCFPEILQ